MVFVSRGNALSLCFDGRQCATFRSPLSREGRGSSEVPGRGTNTDLKRILDRATHCFRTFLKPSAPYWQDPICY